VARLENELNTGDFGWLVGSLCQINRIPFDLALLLQRFPAPHSIRQFVETVNSLGCRTGEGDLRQPRRGAAALLRCRQPGAAGDGAPAKSEFGFRWFWAEFLKHKRIWRDVLLASLFIQLIGLTTPLGTQVVIDKVVAHQTESTLLAIAVGLGMFLLFNAAMGWLRQAAFFQGAGGTRSTGPDDRYEPISARAGHAGLKRNPPRYALDPGVRA